MSYKKNSGVYQIKNKINNKVYIGSAESISKRFWEHKYELRHNKHDNSHLQRAWNKYGENNFEFIIIEQLNQDNILTKEELKEILLKREQYWIDKTKCINRDFGYNKCIKAYSRLGSKIDEDGRKHISESLYKRWSETEDKEHIRTLSQRMIKERGVGVCISQNKLYESDVLIIVDKLESGKSVKDISEFYTTIDNIKLGKSWSHITGIKFYKPKFRHIDKDIILNIVKLINNGLNNTEISKQLNISRQIISNIRCGKTWTEVTGIKSM